MTFAIMTVKEDQRRVVGMLWADDEAEARSLLPALCDCADGERLSVCRMEDREIPLRLADDQPMHFC